MNKEPGLRLMVLVKTIFKSLANLKTYYTI